MSKRVILVGHCGPDSSYLSMAIRSATRDAVIVFADTTEDLNREIADGADLILFNRVLDYGFPSPKGVDLISQLRAWHPDLKMILVSNYDDAQAAAVAAGARPGFGKREIGSPRVKQLLQAALSD